MLDQQQMSAMMAALQQVMQILQQAGAGGGAAPGGGMGGGMGAPPDDGGGMDDPDMDMDDDGGDDDPDMGGDDGGGGASLHDRVSQLEDHTGLQKAAGVPLTLRLDKLESEVLGQEYEGPAVQRVRQLEKSLGIQSRRRGGSRRQRGGAPDVIKLDDLFKSAVSQGVAQALEEMGVDRQPSDLPDPETLRKNARQTQNTYGQRRGTARSVTDADLVKSAESWGWDESTLDEPVSLGDVLQMQYMAAKAGMALPFDGEDDD